MALPHIFSRKDIIFAKVVRNLKPWPWILCLCRENFLTDDELDELRKTCPLEKEPGCREYQQKVNRSLLRLMVKKPESEQEKFAEKLLVDHLDTDFKKSLSAEEVPVTADTSHQRSQAQDVTIARNEQSRAEDNVHLPSPEPAAKRICQGRAMGEVEEENTQQLKECSSASLPPPEPAGEQVCQEEIVTEVEVETTVQRKRASLPQTQKKQVKESHNDDVIEVKTTHGLTFYQCRICKEHFRIRSKCTLHQIVHIDNKPHVCDKCGRSYKRKEHLAVHYRVHTGEQGYRCTECSQAFSTGWALKQHRMQMHEPESAYTCSKCKHTFCDHSSFVRHQGRHLRGSISSTETFPCEHCGRMYAMDGKLQREAKSVDKVMRTQLQRHKCDKCGLGFPWRSALTFHLKNVHGVKKHRPTKKITCEKCGKVVRTEARLQGHMRRHERQKLQNGIQEDLQTKGVDKEQAKKSHGEEEMMNGNKPEKDGGEEEEQEEDSGKKRTQEGHEEEAKDGDSEGRGKDEGGKEQLNENGQEIAKDNESQLTKDSHGQTGNDGGVCGSVISSQSKDPGKNCSSGHQEEQLRSGLTSCHPDQQVVFLKCKECSCEFETEEQRRSHVQDKHPIPRLRCSSCSRIFSCQISLEYHMRNVRRLALKCEKCDASFCNQYLQTLHSKTCYAPERRPGDRDKGTVQPKGKTKKRPRSEGSKKKRPRSEGSTKERAQFVCGTCGKSYAHLRSLRFHSWDVHQENLLCKKCNRVFCSVSLLSKHFDTCVPSGTDGKDVQGTRCDRDASQRLKADGKNSDVRKLRRKATSKGGTTRPLRKTVASSARSTRPRRKTVTSSAKKTRPQQKMAINSPSKARLEPSSSRQSSAQDRGRRSQHAQSRFPTSLTIEEDADSEPIVTVVLHCGEDVL